MNSRFLPHSDTAAFVCWRKREFNKQADYICNVVVDSGESVFHQDSNVIKLALHTGANIYLFPMADIAVMFLSRPELVWYSL